MADDRLNTPVQVRARIRAVSLPTGFSPAYQQYVLSQAMELAQVANKVNQTSGGTYEAQLKNDEQDATLARHETSITTAEGNITALQTRVGAIQDDAVSKSATASQSLAGPLNVATSYSVGGTKVIGPRQTGWTAATGTANKGAFNADLAFTVSATYTQSEIQAIAAALVAERQRTKALEDALRAHGLIN